MNTGLQQKRGYSFFNLFRTFGFHAACLWAFFIEWNLACVILALLSFYIRMFCITGGYHRYFAHHSYKTSRVFQFLMALVATAAGQRGPLTWTTSHRAHHVHSDREGDPHSPQVSSFFDSHIGWVLYKDSMPTSREQIDRFKDFPEIIWLNQYHGVGFIFWVALLFGIQALFPASFGTDQLLVSGFFVPTFFILQGTCLVNSVCHLAPKRQEDTKDYSTNNPWLFPIALGENWHRNHHLYPASASTWVKPYQVDIIYLTIKALEWVGLVWDVKTIKPKREKVWNPST